MVSILLLHAGGQPGVCPQESRGHQARHARRSSKAAEICAVAPEQVAKSIVDKGLAKNYDYALEAIKKSPLRTMA